MEVSDGQVDALLEHLRAWVMAQPAWPLVLASSRQRRKAVAARIAREITRIPVITGASETAQRRASEDAARQAVVAMGLEVTGG